MIEIPLRVLTIIPLFIVVVFSELAAATINPDNVNFNYTGRIDFTDSNKPVIFWPGTYIRAAFEGTSISVLLDDSTGQTFYDVYIDEDYDHPYLIDCKKGSSTYLISSTLKDTLHNLLIFRRTEASTGSTRFLGIEIDDGKSLVEMPVSQKRKILFYGDSITCGMGNEAPDNYADDNLKYENNFLAFGAITSRLLDTDYMCIAKSGIGIMISWFNMVMPQYYYRLNPDKQGDTCDFNNFVPDVVVVNLFQNDSWLLYKLNPLPDSSKITLAYTEFIREIRRRHPNAFIVCTLGSMDATKKGSPWPGYIEKAVQYLRQTDNDTNIGTYFFPFSSTWTKHPRVRHHKEMGKNLADYIKQNTNWTTGTENITSSKIPDEFSISQNYPNPFNPSTTIKYAIDKPGNVKIVVYDALGRQIRTLINEYKYPGSYTVIFNAGSLSAGTYYYQIINGKDIQTKSMLYLK